MAIASVDDLTGAPVVAFNVITLEHAEGILTGAERAHRPVILQLSENAIKFHGSPYPIAAGMVQLALQTEVPVVLHLDHVTDTSLAMEARELGFASVMFDGSALDFAHNVTTTREFASWAHQAGIWVEAELGEVGGKDGVHAPGVRTDPREAAQFVADTGVDALAVAVGSSHAMTTKTADLDFDLISSIHDSVVVPLVLHGSSGVPDLGIREATRTGMWKVNIGTALNVAFTGAIREYLSEYDGVDPRRYFDKGRAAVADVAERYLRLVAESD